MIYGSIADSLSMPSADTAVDACYLNYVTGSVGVVIVKTGLEPNPWTNCVSRHASV